MTATLQTRDVEALAVKIAVLRSQQKQTSELEARRLSRSAFQKWGERIPMALNATRDIELLVERHRDYWLKSASGFVRTLDPAGLGDNDFHVLDFSSLGIVSDRFAGVAFPEGSFGAFAGLLPRTAQSGPVVAVNLISQARSHVSQLLDVQSEETIREVVRVAVTATAIHEAAHVVDNSASGVLLPASTGLEEIRLALQRPSKPKNVSASHREGWVRAFAHLVYRATSRPPCDYWSKVFSFDVGQHYSGDSSELIDVLVPELSATSDDSPIVDTVRFPIVSIGRLLSDRRRPQE